MSSLRDELAELDLAEARQRLKLSQERVKDAKQRLEQTIQEIEDVVDAALRAVTTDQR